MVKKLAAACLLATVTGTAALTSIADTVTVTDWLVVGPFSAGTREGITGVFDDPALFRPAEGDSFRSALVQGGMTLCRKVEADTTGWVATGYENVRWDSIQDYYGASGLFAVGYAYAEFDLPRACRGLALAAKVGAFHLNGLSYRGDAYGTGRYLQPVVLDSGVNRILVPLAGFGDQRFRFKLVPAPGPAVTLCRDATVPDAIADSATTVFLGIPVLNTTEQRLDSVRLTVTLASGSVLAETTTQRLAGLCTRKVPLKVTLPAFPRESTHIMLGVSVSADGDVFPDTIRLRVKNASDPRKETFISGIDGSCQYYGIIYPRDYEPGRRYSLILSLHGAGVEASGQAEAYRPKDWAFVVCPTNRRPFGFDWQDWGRLDALEALDHALATLPIDPDRVCLTGHSMGGHGVWHVGLAHPDRFAALAPEAGWSSHQLYVPWFLQRSMTFAEPAQLLAREQTLSADNAPAMLPNALNLPVFILHGGEDNNVPTFHGRGLAAWLDELGSEYYYKEVPNRGHWWQYEAESLSVVDDPDLMAFLRMQRRRPGPRHVRFRTADLGQSSRAYWLTIGRAITVGRLSEAEAWASDTVLRLTTRNVARLELELDERLFFARSVNVEIDGQNLGRVPALPAHVTAHREAGRWRLGPARVPGLRKRPELYGPARQAMFRPFVLVYGTRDPALAEYLRHSAVQEAMRWWQRANGLTEVLPDTEVTRQHVADCNLVLYGSPSENGYVRRIQSGLPIQQRGARLFLAGRDLGTELACLFVHPNPENPDRLVLVRMGTDEKMTRLSSFWAVLQSAAGVPDFMVWDKSVRRLGWAGVRAAGFFDPLWRIDPASSWFRE